MASSPLARTLVAACLIAVMTGCQGKSDSPAGKLPPPQLQNVLWTLTELPTSPIKVPAAGEADIRFDEKDKRVAGSTGLNRFNGSYELSGKTLRFGPLAATKRAGPPELMNLESAYIRALLATTSWRIEGQTLELLGYDGKPTARFRPAPTPTTQP